MVEFARHIPESRRANKADVAQFFGCELTTINRWIAKGLPAIQQGRKGVPWVFDLLACAEWRFSGNIGGAAGDQISPEDMPPKERKDWYDGEEKRRKLARDAGELCTTDEFRDSQAQTLKQVAMALETLPDVLERACNIGPETVIKMQQVLDDQRTALAEKISGNDSINTD